MPNRIIRESALTSHTLAKLSDGAERLFWRLTIVADDHGRFDAYGVTVMARCFPVLADTLSPLKIGKWLAELSRDHVQFYEVEGRQYGQFRKWAEYQRSYGLKSKFPQPPADCGEVPQVPADSRSYPISDIRESISENRDTRIENRDTVGLTPNESPIDRLVGFLNRKAGRGFKVTNPDGSETSTARLVKALLKKGYTEEQIQQVIANRYLAWGNDPKMQDNLRPSTLFRPSNFENYVGMLGQEVS